MNICRAYTQVTPDKMPKFPDGGQTLPDGGGSSLPKATPRDAAPA